MKRETIYFDHAAATPIDRRVIAVMRPYFSDIFYNPSSSYSQAVSARQVYNEAKHKLASLIGAKPGEIIITAGATESINLAFWGVNGHVITSNIEHPAVILCAKREKHTIISSDKKGIISVDAVKAAIKPDTQLISITLANNEIGTIQPIREIANLIKNERENRLLNNNKIPIYFHTDASQGASLLDINVARLGVDMLTLNAGKIYGPKQVGLLYVASHVRIKPFIVGGGQESGLRSGTENVAGTIGFASALELANKHYKYESNRLMKLRDELQQVLKKAFPNAIISGHSKHRLANYLHISFPGLDGERLLYLLDNRGLLVATGSACSANKGVRSHVLIAIGLSDEVADGSIRITLGHLSTPENVKLAEKIMIKEINQEYKRVGL